MASTVKLVKGGTQRFVIEGFKNKDFITIPKDFKIEKISVLKSNTTAGNIKLGYYTAPVAEVQTLTVTAEPTASGNLAVTLDGTAVQIAILDADLIPDVARKISEGTYAGWKVTLVGTTKVVFEATAVGAKAGAFSLSGLAGVAGTFVETRAGVTEAIGTEVVNTAALSGTIGNFADLTLVKDLFASQVDVYIGVDSAATGTLAVQIQKLF